MISILFKNATTQEMVKCLKIFTLVNTFKVDISNFITKVGHEEKESRLSCIHLSMKSYLSLKKEGERKEGRKKGRKKKTVHCIGKSTGVKAKISEFEFHFCCQVAL